MFNFFDYITQFNKAFGFDPLQTRDTLNTPLVASLQYLTSYNQLFTEYMKTINKAYKG